MTKKVYIAGPDVFSPYAVNIGKDYKRICSQYGFVGLYPLDNEGDHTSEEIFRANMARIDDADFIVANINFFRGYTMDDGTAWEIGYAFAKGKIVYCYTRDGNDLVDKIGDYDEAGFIVENFNHPINLMIAESTNRIVVGDFEDCIKALAEKHY